MFHETAVPSRVFVASGDGAGVCFDQTAAIQGKVLELEGQGVLGNVDKGADGKRTCPKPKVLFLFGNFW